MQRKAEEAVLEAAKAKMSAEEIDGVIGATKALKEAQLLEDSAEDLASIPRVGLADLERKIKTYPTEVDGLAGGGQLLTHPLPTAGVVYADILLDLSAVPVADLPLVRLFSELLDEVGTSELDAVALQRRIGARTGGINPAMIYEQPVGEDGSVGDPYAIVSYLALRGKATVEKADELFELVHQLLADANFAGGQVGAPGTRAPGTRARAPGTRVHCSPPSPRRAPRAPNEPRRLTDPRRSPPRQTKVIEMLRETQSRLETSFISSGNSFAGMRLAARNTLLGYVGELTQGVTYYEEVKAMLSMAKDDWPSLLARLERVRDILLAQRGLIINLTADPDALAAVRPTVDAFVSKLPAAAALDPKAKAWRDDVTLLPRVDEAYAITTQVRHVACCLLSLLSARTPRPLVPLHSDDVSPINSSRRIGALRCRGLPALRAGREGIGSFLHGRPLPLAWLPLGQRARRRRCLWRRLRAQPEHGRLRVLVLP